MRILLLNSWYYPNLKGGAEHSVKLLAENLVKSGNEVAVFTIDGKDTSLTIEQINGVNVFRGTGGKYNIRKAYQKKKTKIESIKNKVLEIYNPSIVKELEIVLSDFHPNIVHANCIAGISLIAIQYFQSKGLPIVYTLRDYFLDNPKNIIEKVSWHNPLKKILLLIYRTYVKKQINNVEAVTAPSTFTLNYYVDNGYFKNVKYKECIVNSVDINIEEVLNNLKEKSLHAKRNFMYAGSIIKTKGIIPMLEAFMQTDIDTNLFVCGEGNLITYVEACAQTDRRIKVLGKLSPEKLAEVYVKSDIMLVPSLWAEPFGRVVIEAAKYGLFVIGSINGGIPEIINELKCGKICNVNDVELFRETMLQAYYNNCITASNNIIENISKYDIASQIKSFNKLYNAIIKI